jgi:hypothetical protein
VTTIVDIAAEAGNDDSKESMVREYDDAETTALELVSMLVDDKAGST